MIHALSFLLLHVSAYSASSCTADFDKLQSRNQEIYDKARASQPNNKELDDCYQIVRKKIDNCATQYANGPCSNDAVQASGQGTKSVEGAVTSTVKLQVNQANCGYGMGQCFKRGGQYDEGENVKIQGCMVDNAAKHEMDAQDTGTRTQAARSGGVVMYVMNASDEIIKPQFKCWYKLGQDAEAGARKSLVNAKSARATNPSTAAIDCLNQDNGNRLCAYHEDGGSRVKEIKTGADGKAKIEGAAPAHLAGVGCSGTVIGDQVTVITAGHCTNGKIRDGAGEQEIQVIDRTGKAQTVSGTCKAGVWDGGENVDISTCTLKKPVDANPVYFATVDSKMSGNRCEDEGYIMRCGEGFFKDLSRKPAVQYGYPARENIQTGDVQNNLISSRGAIMYDEETKRVTYDMLCTGGCSGSGIMVDVNGRRVAIAADSYGSRFEVSSGAAIVPYETMRQLTVQSVSREKLDAGRELFQSLPLEP